MDIQDLLFDPDVDPAMKTEVLEFIQTHRIIDPYLKVLTPTDANDDVNGSQHNTNGGNDFTYRDADKDDVRRASSFGYYEYFSACGSEYTGHYYDGDRRHFDALVIDPPAYAASQYL